MLDVCMSFLGWRAADDADRIVFHAVFTCQVFVHGPDHPVSTHPALGSALLQGLQPQPEAAQVSGSLVYGGAAGAGDALTQ